MYRWWGPEQRLSTRFGKEGLFCNEGLGARLLQEISRRSGTNPPGKADERMWLDLLGQARPAGRATTAILIEGTAAEIMRKLPLAEIPEPAERDALEATSDTVMAEALDVLLDRLGRDHPSYAEVLFLQYRLLDNIARVRRNGESAERRGERAEIVDRLNRVGLVTLGSSFLETCRSIGSRRILVEISRAAAARTLADMVEPLHRNHIHLKMFAPEPGVEALPWEHDRVPLQWSELLLRELLSKRMEFVHQPGGLRSLCHPQYRGLDLDCEIVRLAGGLPGRLVALGNELLAHVGTRPDPGLLIREDLEHLQQVASTIAV